MSEDVNSAVKGVWDAFPKGIVIPWYSTEKELPKSMAGIWALCDGKNGTPNLSDGRFLRGVVAVAGNNSDQGGAESHDHSTGKGAASGDGFQSQGDDCRFVGVSQASNLPPFLNVRFIMKVKA